MVAIYACTIFLSAFLLFQVQPIIGKAILPWFGGSAAVWSTCMLFFQLLLLLGYAYAHVTTTRLRPTRQAALHIGLLLASAALLPILPDASWKPAAGAEPVSRILLLLTASIGLPYFLLATTGPLLQAWFVREAKGRIPYRLFALSNLGSMLGLLSYPLLFEPRLPLREMSQWWSLAYGGFALCCAALAARNALQKTVAGPCAESSTPSSSFARPAQLRCATLAALPTILLMATTSHLTTNIAPVPLLWIAPFAIYLITFILCFEGRDWYKRHWFLPIFALVMPGLALLLILPSPTQNVLLLVALFCYLLFIGCMTCHGELARLRPDPQHLTAYYLTIAAGGAAGGIFVALIAPNIFNDEYELLLAALAAFVVVFLVVLEKHSFARKAVLATASLCAMLAAGKVFLLDRNDIKERNFYGTVKVKDTQRGEAPVRQLSHGLILHGFQYLDAERQAWPTSYFGPGSGAALGIAASRTKGAQRVGVVGLGVGTIAAYCRPGDYYRFYEINPAVTELAQTQFSFLKHCTGTVEVVGGDARLSMEAEAPQLFDTLILDAFSGDAIPVHLLTQEAFAVYAGHVRKGGVLAVHISNSHLDLVPVVQAAAHQLGMAAWLVDSPADKKAGTNHSLWVLLRDGTQTIDGIRLASRRLNGRETALRAWTDDYSSIRNVLK